VKVITNAMPRIDTDLKLDFKDVLFRPKRSTIRSRADVGLIIFYSLAATAEVDWRGGGGWSRCCAMMVCGCINRLTFDSRVFH